MTNNLAEYTALTEALKYTCAQADMLKQRGVTVEIKSDSQLIVNQVNGAWRVGNENLLDHHKLATDLIAMLIEYAVPVTLEWIPREQNEEADALTRAAFKEARHARH